MKSKTENNIGRESKYIQSEKEEVIENITEIVSELSIFQFKFVYRLKGYTKPFIGFTEDVWDQYSGTNSTAKKSRPARR
ncbi:hypothetical protein GWI33_016441 [Rhynchophorus ferrugineus]|uniref:Uncharacterized protein n=1 Tax=Rhynchophorus ferrugineus TaxID=354439 RepID=A0A834M8Q4_RHYFE|nr:hypothetical protein GWI33_016441 [Rhynchophorus ferrugineus]